LKTQISFATMGELPGAKGEHGLIRRQSTLSMINEMDRPATGKPPQPQASPQMQRSSSQAQVCNFFF